MSNNQSYELPDLPEPIIQHIQSFMEVNNAAQTSLLSKSWYNAWSSHPILDLDDSCFCNSSARNSLLCPSKFWNFATKTVQRYIDQNVSVDKLILRVEGITDDDCSCLDKFILHTSKLRVNELTMLTRARYALPAQLFEQRYLTKVELEGCVIKHLLVGNILWTRLVSLNLFDVCIENAVLMDIFSRCPLIEYLDLTSCKRGLTNINVSRLHNLKTLVVSHDYDTFVLEFGEYRFINLSRLVLKKVKIGDGFFTNFASQFPNLEDLTLDRLDHGRQNIQFSSRSLKFLSLILAYDDSTIKIEFDIPNISKFKFSCGKRIPVLSFTTASEPWESEIELRCVQCNRHSSFLVVLRNLVENLCQSKISLNINLHSYRHYINNRNVGISPVVENLVVSFYDNERCNSQMAVCGLLWSCCPKFMNLLYHDDMKVTQAKQICLDQDYLGRIYDLCECRLEFSEESVMERKLYKTVLDAQEILDYRPEQLRLKLIWGRNTPAQTIVNFSVIEKSSWSI